ncbi:MAG: hypothetical protein DI601_06350 [Azospirillum brasilense]|nr:MAG: hypothetical protein DI601_06350 [Azospirillum brasilense]
MLDVHKSVVDTVNKFLADTGMSPTRLGVAACADGHLVRELRAGRITLNRIQVVMRYIANYRQPVSATTD